MGKAKRQKKKELREARSAETKEETERREAELAALERRRRTTVVAIPLVTAALAAAAYFGLGDSRLAGVALLIGGLAFIGYGVSLLGGKVEPRDRDRAGSIDFGNRK